MPRQSRRLSAVVSADVAGYSRLIGQDEVGTVQRLKAHRTDVIEPLVDDCGGRIVKTTGDGLLLEFPSVVDAVDWAMEVQHRMLARNAGLSEREVIQFRLGVHLGDVMADGDDILGDGVNVAARLEAIAPVGGLAVSGVVYDYLDETAAGVFEDAGEQRLKNIRRPIRVWRWRPRTDEAALSPVVTGAASPVPATAGTDAAPDQRPSIAILPFRSLGHDQDFLSEGIVEDLNATLAQISGLIVISRGSSARYGEPEVDLGEVARDLGARYLLRGSVHAVGDRVRVTARLTDTATSAEIWADRYDHTLDDVFELQDRLTKEIVTALRITLTDGEQARVWLRSTDNVTAWRYAMRGADCLWQGSAAKMALARELLEKAVAEDPDYAAAFGLLGVAHYFDLRFGYAGDPAKTRRAMAECTDRALTLKPGDPYALSIRANQMTFEGRFDDAVATIQAAIARNPNDAILRLAAARILINADRAGEAEREVRTAMRLNPHYPVNYLAVLANALIDLGRNDEALANLSELLARNPGYISAHLHLTYLYTLMGRPEEARREAREILHLDPDYDLGKAANFYLSSNEARKAAFLDSLGAAGVPG
jgi:adenylate cyclase